MSNKNLSDNLKLDLIWEKRYRIARFFVYLVFATGFFCAAYLVLFPSANFIFSFPNPDSAKNTIVEPRNENGDLIKNGKVKKETDFIFDANPLGNFSEAEIKITLEKKSEEIKNGSISVRKSFRSFFYPEGEEIDDFKNVSFAKFLSTKESVYLASGNRVWPIADAITFESMGWNWDDVAPSNSEEIGSFEKQKIFTLRSPHPDGTVFSDRETGKYYLIENGEKRLVKNQANLVSLMKTSPVIAEEKGLTAISSCTMESSWKFLRKYRCLVPIREMQNLLGNDYEFRANFGQDVDIRNLEITFKKSFNFENLKSSLATLKNRFKVNYYGQNQ